MSLENETIEKETTIEVEASNSNVDAAISESITDTIDAVASAETLVTDTVEESNTAETNVVVSPAPSTVTAATAPAVKSCQLPFARIKTIMKLDSDLGLTSKESVYLVAKATVY